MNPAVSTLAYPSADKPRPLICEWGAIRDERWADVLDGGGRALCATGADEDDALADMVGDRLEVSSWLSLDESSVQRAQRTEIERGYVIPTQSTKGNFPTCPAINDRILQFSFAIQTNFVAHGEAGTRGQCLLPSHIYHEDMQDSHTMFFR